MEKRPVGRMRRSSLRLLGAASAVTELLESRLLLSSYTVSSLADSGAGTLRDAIANSSADTLTFSIGGSILLHSQLEIDRDLTITGPGAAGLSINGQNLTRVFQVDAGATVEMDGLKITAGRAADGTTDASGMGTAGANGGAILNTGRLSLANDTISGNVAGTGGDGAPSPDVQSSGDGGPGGSGGAIYNTGTLVLTNVTLSGNAAGNGGIGKNVTDPVSDSGSGGVGGSGGAIYNDAAGTVRLDADTITNNFAGAGGLGGTCGGGIPGYSGFGGPGGAIYNAGAMVVVDSKVIGNKAGNGADGQITVQLTFGGVGGDGGGFFNRGTLSLTDVTISGNTAGNGGAGQTPSFSEVGGDGGDAGFGGGINSAQGTLVVSGCLLFGNAAGAGGPGATGGPGSTGGMGGLGGSGGGIQCGGTSSLVLNDSTITGNSGGAGGAGGDGGAPQDGIGGDGGDASQGGSGAGLSFGINVATLTNDTISSNVPGPGGRGGRATSVFNVSGLDRDPGVGAGIAIINYSPGGDVTIYNTICDGIFGALDAALASGQQPSSNNLIGTGGSGGLTNGTHGNIVGVADLKLGPLGNYGGATQTLSLLAGSRALDAGSDSLASAAGLTTDQRGFSRVFNNTVDIGAFEAQPPALAGDVNHDGTVNFADLLLLAQHYGSNQPLFENGDLTGDGTVGFDDLLLLAQSYGRGGTSPAARIAATMSRRRGTQSS